MINLLRKLIYKFDSRLRAAEASIPSIQTAVLTADFSKTNNTLTAVTGWSDTITLEAGKTYRVTGQLQAEQGDDLVLAYTTFNGGTATMTGVRGSYIRADDTGLASDLYNALNGTISCSYGGFIQIDITLQVNAGGTLNLQFAQGDTNAAASTLFKYSTISAQEISPTPSY